MVSYRELVRRAWEEHQIMVLTGQTEYEIGRKNPEVPSKFLNVYDFGKKVHPQPITGIKDIPRVLASTEIITVVVFKAGQRLVL